MNPTSEIVHKLIENGHLKSFYIQSYTSLEPLAMHIMQLFFLKVKKYFP